LKFLAHILRRYTRFIRSALLPLGPWGVLGIAFVDAAFLGVPLDPVVAGWVYADQHRWWLYVFMAAVGSAMGSVVLWFAGLKGGEPFLEKRFGRRRVEQMRDRFAEQEFIALAGAAMLPPPAPFKLFILSAGVFDMRLGNFLLAILVGRTLRFTVVSFLTIRFGPQIVNLAVLVVRRHLALLLLALAILIAMYLLIRRIRRPGSAPSC